MCGIFGMFTKDPGDIANPEMAEVALRRLRHRGPDSSGLWKEPSRLLGQTRLSIIDLDARANPPMRNGANVLVFNGEVYNYQSLRKALTEKGCQFNTSSDTEVLLNGLIDRDIGFIDRVEGMFAFAWWDGQKQTLHLARDRFGEKPLYWFFHRGVLAFASELPALEALIGSARMESEREFLPQYLAYSYIPAPATPYKHIQQLMPGHRLVLNMADWEITTLAWYELQNRVRPVEAAQYKICREEVRNRLRESVRQRYEAADVPVATFLSGGVDSSIITLLASEIAPKVKAYSVSFPEDPAFDEVAYAREVVGRRDNIEHRVVEIRQRELLDNVQAILTKLGEPYADSSLIPTAYMCSQVEEKVALAGDAADEFFCGYAWHASVHYGRKLPAPCRWLLRSLPTSTNPARLSNRWRRAAGFLQQNLSGDVWEEYFNWHEYLDSELLKGLGLDPAKNEELASHYPALRSGDEISDLQVFDIQFNLANDMLKKVDLASMFHSLEVRLPFLDSNLAEWVLGLPGSYKIKWGRRKRILKDAFAQELPSSVQRRGKMGFLLPVREWLCEGQLRDILEGYAGEQQWVEPNALRQALAAHAKGERDHTTFLWGILVLMVWHAK